MTDRSIELIGIIKNGDDLVYTLRLFFRSKGNEKGIAPKCGLMG